MDSGKLGKKSKGLMAYAIKKILEVHYIILKSNEFMSLDIHIQIKIIISNWFISKIHLKIYIYSKFDFY